MTHLYRVKLWNVIGCCVRLFEHMAVCKLKVRFWIRSIWSSYFPFVVCANGTSNEQDVGYTYCTVVTVSRSKFINFYIHHWLQNLQSINVVKSQCCWLVDRYHILLIILLFQFLLFQCFLIARQRVANSNCKRYQVVSFHGHFVPSI